jgi:hypothetical protein
MTQFPALASIQDAAKLLNVSTKTLRRWEARGVLVPVRTVGGHRRYELDKIRELKGNRKHIRLSPTPQQVTVPEPLDIPVLYKGLHVDQKKALAVGAKVIILTLVSYGIVRFTPPEMVNALSSKMLGQTISSNIGSASAMENAQGSVLAAATSNTAPTFNINIESAFKDNSIFTKDVEVDGNLTLKSKIIGNVDLTGNVIVGGNSITTSQNIFNLLNTTATTLNIGGAGTTISIGATTGNTTVNNNLNVKGTETVTGAATITGSETVGGKLTASGDLSVAGATALGGAETVAGKITGSGDLAISGATSLGGTETVSGKITGSGDLAISGNATFGNITSINGVAYSFPTTQGAASTLLTDDGSGNLTWTNPSLGAFSGVLAIANGGTNNSAAYTAGSVIFSDGTKLTQDNANFFYDSATKRLGIGNAAPGVALDVTGAGRFSSTLTASNGLTLTTGALNLTSTSGTANLTSTATSGNSYALTNTSLNTASSSLASFTFQNNNTAGAGVAVNGISVVATGSTPLSGTNTENLINLSGTTLGNNTFNGVNFGNGLNNYVQGTNFTVTAAGAETLASTITTSQSNLVTTSTDGVVAINTTAATAGVPVQISPRLRLSGTVWDTGAVASRVDSWKIENVPTSGNPGTSRLVFGREYNGAGYTEVHSVDSSGNVITNGNVAVNGGSLTTTSSTANIFNSATTIALGNGNSATTLNIGSGSGGNVLNLAGTGATGTDTINLGTGGTNPDTINIGNSASTTTINLTRGGSGNIVFTGFNCNGFSNGGKLTTDTLGNVECANDITAAGSGTNFWQQNAEVLTPYIPTLDVTTGGTATASALFHAYGIEMPTSNIASLTSSTITTGSVLHATASAITHGSIVKLGEGGNQIFDGNVLYADIDHSGGGGGVFTGNFLKFDNNQSTKFTVGSTGLMTTVGGVNISGANSTIDTSSHTLTLNLGSDSTGDIYYRNVSGNLARLNIGSAGQTLVVSGAGIPSWVGGSGVSGSDGWWQRNSGVVAPVNITDDLVIGAAATSSAKFQAFGVENATGNVATLTSSVINSGSVLYATASAITSGNIIKLGQGGDSAFSGNAIYADLDRTGGGGGTFTGNFLKFDNALTTRFTVSASGNIAVAAGSGLDTISAGTLNLGTSTANAVSISKSGVTTTVNGALTSSQTLTASNGLTLTTGALNLTSTSGITSLTSTATSGNAFEFIDNSLNTAAANLQSLTFKNNNTGGAGLSVNGINVAATGSTPTGGTNTENLINLSATALGSNTFNGINFGNGLTNYINGTNFSVTSAGLGTFAGGLAVTGGNTTVTNNILPAVTDTSNIGSSSSVEFNNIFAKAFTQNNFSVCDTSGNCGAVGNFWGQTNGALYPVNNTVDVLFGATAGATATASAHFAFTNITGAGVPTASISGNIANVRTFIDGNGNISSTNRNNLTLGNSATYNFTGNTLLNPNGTGNVGIGVTAPGSMLEVGGKGQFGLAAASTAQLVVNGGASGGDMVQLVRTSGGSLTYGWNLAGNKMSFNNVTDSLVTLQTSHSVTMSNTSEVNVGFDYGASDTHTGDQGLLKGSDSGGAGADSAGGTLYIASGRGTGNSTPSTLIFQTPTAGVSGTTRQTLNTRMTIDTTGNVGIGDTTPSKLFVVGNGDLFQVDSAGNVKGPTLALGTGTIAPTDRLFDINTSTALTNAVTYTGTAQRTLTGTLTGNITDYGVFSSVAINASDATFNHTTAALDGDISLTNGKTTDSMYGGQFNSNVNSSTLAPDTNRTATTSAGIFSGAFNNSTGTVFQQYGVFSQTANSGNNTTSTGVYGKAANENNTMSNALGVQGDAISDNASSTISNAYGVQGNVIKTLGTITNGYAGYFNIGTAVTTAYGVYANVTGAGTTNYGVYSNVSGAGTNYAGIFMGGNVGVGLTNPTDLLSVSQTTTTGKAINVSRNLGSASTDSPIVSINQLNSGDDQYAFDVENIGGGGAANISNTGSAIGLNLNQGTTGTGFGVNIFSNVDATVNNPLVNINVANAAFDQQAFYISNAGTANAERIDNSGSATALFISGTGTGNLANFDTTNASANGLLIDVQSSSSSQYGLKVTSNNGSTNGLYVRADGNVGIGTITPTALLDVNGNASVSGTLAFHTGTGTIQSTTFSPLVLGGTTTGNITLSPSNDIAGGFVAPNVTNVSDLGTASLLWRNIRGTNIFQGANQVCDSSGAHCLGNSLLWQLNSLVVSPANSTYDLTVGGTATGSAFQVFGLEKAADSSSRIVKINSTVITTGSLIEATSSAITSGSFIKLGQGGDAAFSGAGILFDFANTGGGGTNFSGDFIVAKKAGNIMFDVGSAGNVQVNGGSITTTATTANVFNATATTLSLGGAATTALNIGNGNSAMAAINIGSGTGGNTINIAGTGATGSDTVNIGTDSTSADTINIGNNTSTSAINLNSGTAPQFFRSLNATGKAQSGSFVFKDASLSSGDMIYATSAGALSSGNLFRLGTGGNTNFTGNVIQADIDNTGQGGLGFTGNFLKFSNGDSTVVTNTKYTLDSAGNASESGTLTLGNGSTIRPAFGPLTLSYKSAADTWTTGFTLTDTTGNVGIGQTAPTNKLEVALSSNQMVLLGTGGVASGVAFVNGSILSQNSQFQITAATAPISFYTGSTFDTMTPGTERMRLSNAGGLSLGNAIVGTDPGAGNASMSGTLTLGNGSTIRPAFGPLTLSYKSAADTWTTGISLGDVTGSQSFTSGVATTTGTSGAFSFNAGSLTTGTGAYVNSGSITTGDLVLINSTGTTLTTGNLLNVQNNSSSVFTVGASQITSALPHQFTAAGDVTMAYDLIFTNQTASTIDSYGPLTVRAGESFENNNLTLTSYNAGNILLNTGTTGGKVGIGAGITPIGLLTVDSSGVGANAIGKAAFIVNQAETQDIFSASASGTPRVTLNNAGNFGIGTTTPGNLLDILYASTATAAAMIRTSSNADTVGLAIKLGHSTLDTGDRFINFLNSAGTIIGKVAAATNTTVSFTGNGTDLAEYFVKDDPNAQFATGTVMCQGTNGVKACSTTDSAKIIGIVSDSPVFLGGIEGPNKVILALTGQVPVLMDPSSPNLNPGDLITVSNNGLATKATSAGFVIGRAQQNWTSGTGDSTRVIVSDIWADPTMSLTASGNLNAVPDSKNPGYSKLTDGNGNSINMLSGLTSIITNTFYSFQITVDTMLVKAGLVSPEVLTREIKPLAGEHDVAIKIGEATASGQLLIKNSLDKVVAGIDDTGNATFSGQLNSQNASISGSIHAGTIYADQIVSKDAKFGDTSTNTLGGITRDQIENLLTSIQQDQNLQNQAQNWSTSTATASAALNELDLKNLYVTGITALDSLSVTNGVTIGGDLVIAKLTNNQNSLTSINTIDTPLSIQTSASQPLYLMAGKVKIDTTGNVQVLGNLAVGGVLSASAISIAEDPNATTSATLGTVFLDSQASAGQAKIASGSTEITIRNPNIKADSLIFVTPTSPTSDTLYVKSKTNGNSTIGFKSPASDEVDFNWWIVNLVNGANQ